MNVCIHVCIYLSLSVCLFVSLSPRRLAHYYAQSLHHPLFPLYVNCTKDLHHTRFSSYLATLLQSEVAILLCLFFTFCRSSLLFIFASLLYFATLLHLYTLQSSSNILSFCKRSISSSILRHSSTLFLCVSPLPFSYATLPFPCTVQSSSPLLLHPPLIICCYSPPVLICCHTLLHLTDSVLYPT